jgi:Recombination endonuclease VII
MPSTNPEVQKAYRKAHKEEIKAQRAAFRASHKEELKVANAAYCAENKEKLKTKRAEHHAEHKEEHNAISREYHSAHKEEEKAYRVVNRERIRSNRFKRKYGISLEDWNKLFVIQKGRCPICNNSFTKTGKRRAHTDHCHKSGHVRGLICHSCNTAEGQLGSPEVVLALYNYMMQNELLSYQNGAN